MAWIESHQELERHPKTLLLQRSLNVTLDETIGKLHRFWWWTLTYCEDGQIEKFGLQAISDALGFDAQKLVDSGFIDTTPQLQVHDWWDYVKHFLAIRYKHNLDKYNKIKALYTPVQTTLKERSTNRKNNPLPNLTIPNLTINSIKHPSGAAVSKEIPPSIEALTLYIKEISAAINPQEFLDHYEANGWMRGKSKVKDWKACVRTWKHRNNPVPVKDEVWRDANGRDKYGRDAQGFIN